MGHPSRRGEPAGIEAELGRHRRVHHIVPPATLEGGDVVRLGRRLPVGRSGRSNAQGMEQLQAIARDYQVIPVGVRGCLHLKSACTALPDGSLLVNRDRLDVGALAKIPLVDVDAAEPEGSNVVSLGNRVIISAAYPRTAALLGHRGFEVHPVEVSEFAKVEGCVSCMSLLIEVQ